MSDKYIPIGATITGFALMLFAALFGGEGEYILAFATLILLTILAIATTIIMAKTRLREAARDRGVFDMLTGGTKEADTDA